MERQLRTLTVLLILSLILTAYSLYQTGQYREEVNRISSNMHGALMGVQNNVNSNISSLDRRITQLQEGQKWITSISYLPDKHMSTPEQIYLQVQWSFSEVEKDAEVYLLYRHQNNRYQNDSSGDWMRAEAMAVEGPNYAATLALSPNDMSSAYEYQIVAEGSRYRTAPPITVPGALYQATPLYLSSWGGSRDRDGGWIGKMHYDIDYRAPTLFDFFRVVSLEVELTYNDGSKARADVEQISRGEYNTWRFEFEVDELKSAEIVAVFGDGTKRTSTLWPQLDDEDHKMLEWREQELDGGR